MNETLTVRSRLTGAYGRALLVARTRAGLSQRAAQAATGYGLSSIGRYERGERSLDTDDLARFAEAYHTTPSLISREAERIDADSTFVWPPALHVEATVEDDIDVITASALADQGPDPREL